MEGPRDVKSFIIPAPTGGLNFKEALPMMRADTAIAMSNLIPNGATVDVRKAVRRWNTISTASTLRGLFNYNCPNGNQYLIGIADWTYTLSGSQYLIRQLWDLTGTGTLIHSVGAFSTVDYWPEGTPAAVNFGGYLFFIFDNAGWFNALRLGPPSGVGGTFTIDPLLASGDLILTLTRSSGAGFGTLGVYKNRIYIADTFSAYTNQYGTNINYTNVSQVAGVLPTSNTYDISYLTKRGGKIIFADSVTRQEGQLSQALFAVITTEGEVLVFQGDYPGSTTWALMGYYVIPKPLGKRAFFYIGSSLYIITQSGIFSFADLTSNYGISSEIAFSSDYINNKFPEYAAYALSLNSLSQGTTAFYGTYFPKENKVFVGYPESPSTYGMLVQDLTTKGWGQLNYRNQIAGLTVHKDNLYGFAPASYTYTLQSLNSHDELYLGGKWQNWPISYSAQLAANYNGDFSTTKQFTEVKAFVECTTPYSITAGLAVDFDLRSAGVNNYSHQTGGTYGLYQPKFNTGDRENVGKCCIINIGGQAQASDLPIKFVAFEVYYTEGGNW